MLKTFTTSDELLQVLNGLMKLPLLSDFRLVGGTALSLIYGHRKSEDIDLFAYEGYGSIDFKKIETELIHHFAYVRNDDNIPGLLHSENNFGLHLHIGTNSKDSIKTDILNWSVADFLDPIQIIDNIRFATPLDIALMKLDTIARGGRKKDFWDMSELLEHFTLPKLLKTYQIKYPFHAVEDILTGLANFDIAENMPDPICLKGKYWEQIKDEVVLATKNIQHSLSSIKSQHPKIQHPVSSIQTQTTHPIEINSTTSSEILILRNSICKKVVLTLGRCNFPAKKQSTLHVSDKASVPSHY